MAVLQSMTALAQTGVEPAIPIGAGAPAGSGGNCLFGSIFSKAVGTANRQLDAGSGGTAPGQNEATGLNGAATATAARLYALIRQLAGVLDRSMTDTGGNNIQKNGKNVKSADQKNPSKGEVTEAEDKRQDDSGSGDISQVIAALGQMLSELKVALQSGNTSVDDDSKTALIEKSIRRIEEKLDKMQNSPAMEAAGAQTATASGGTQNLGTGEMSGTGVQSSTVPMPGSAGNVNVAGKDSLLQMVENLRQIIEGKDAAKDTLRADNATAGGFTRKEVAGGSDFPKFNGLSGKEGGNATSTAGKPGILESHGLNAEIIGFEAVDVKTGKKDIPVNGIADWNPAAYGQDNQKASVGTLTAGYEEFQWKTASKEIATAEVKGNISETGKNGKGNALEPDVPVKTEAVSGTSKTPAEIPAAPAMKVVLSKVEQNDAGFAAPDDSTDQKSVSTVSMIKGDTNATPAKSEATVPGTRTTLADTVESKFVSENVANAGNVNTRDAGFATKASATVAGTVNSANGGERISDFQSGKTEQTVNNGNSSGAGSEAALKGKSAAGDASGEHGGMAGKGQDNAKENIKMAEVNIGMRSQDVSYISSAKADMVPSEPVKTISPEQILTQVREKLAEAPIKGDSGVISLKLHPDELGELKVNVRLEDQKLKVEVIAENKVVKDVLAQNLNSLKETLSRHNLTMEKFDVLTTGNGGSNQQQFQEGSQPEWKQTINGYVRNEVPSGEERTVTAKYLDQSENSLVDVRF